MKLLHLYQFQAMQGTNLNKEKKSLQTKDSGMKKNYNQILNQEKKNNSAH